MPSSEPVDDITCQSRSPGSEEANEHTHLKLKSQFCYPGWDATFSSRVFLSLYEEEEASEHPEWPEEYDMMDMGSGFLFNTSETTHTHHPTIYFMLRLFDSIRGFHKGYLDLSGRHPERYYELQSQWNRFLCGLLSFGAETRTSQERDSFDIADSRLKRWRRFQIKWHLPESTSYGQLLKCTQSVLRELKQHPVPEFQVARLTDLPVEVLDHAIGLASTAQAKALSCTCHKLNDIGQRHIFRTWHMKLHVPPHVTPFNVEYSDIDLPLLAHYSRQDLEKNAEFVLSAPHISHRVQKLVLTDEWWVNRRAHPHDNNPFALGMDFYKSVTQTFASVLRAASNLSTLALYNLEISVELARRIAETPTLHTLELHLCHIPHTVRKKLVADATLVFPQIANLRVYMDSSFPETHSQWYSLLLCPHIRTLSVVQFGGGPFPAPDAVFWMKCRLNNLERLSLDNIDSGDLAELAEFLLNSGTAMAYLTHFKLHMDWGVPDSEVLTLLLALQTAPLEVLVLEGLAEAEFVIFEQIISQYPDLVALTLVRRQNRNQHHNKFALWPHASWEYASYFQGFKALRHFCWNFRTEYWDATPSTLLAFESGFSSPSPSAKDHLDFDLADEVPPYFLDSHWMALPFAAHCPTLQSFSLMDRTVDMVCRIHRSAITGATALTPKYYPTHSSVSWNVQQWNTTASHWPILSPLAKPRSG
ncbi:hypothetical protein BDZ97DRAFT_1926341 [Flammula alnicola]|nr:hypothetical protein BDZ97DRAFT_1926341 [Flammula alnicola]